MEKSAVPDCQVVLDQYFTTYRYSGATKNIIFLDNWKYNIRKRKISSDSDYRDTNWWKSQQFLTVKLF